ncbi:unnamed protein product [Lymnaea stagnalis]|uniref:CW-type domain-containing protein n=1 Tax=Lymnaea stagnalis TaxID=6523 RepID=A0AAV2IEM0_LYMST
MRKCKPKMATKKGPLPGQVHPRFFNTNATSHKWALGAIAELIDNSYDPDVRATRLAIDMIDMKGKLCLTFKDDGAGMDKEGLTKMLSFGFCTKEKYNQHNAYEPIGQYGNGFKSGSMRLGKDALVITRCRDSASIGFLSQTYLENINAETIEVPIINYKLPQLQRLGGAESKRSLDTILQYAPFDKEDELKNEIRALEVSLTTTGTKIILYNLEMLRNGQTELDFSSDPTDIRCPETHLTGKKNPDNRPIEQNSSKYKHSLREYCSILYFHPRMKIRIRGQDVKPKFIARSLSQTKNFFYKPNGQRKTDGKSTDNVVDNNPTVVITLGYTCEEGPSKDYGMMLYHRNRLITAYEKVGCQKQNTGRGVDVVGVAKVDMLTPTHNKQDFMRDDKYNSVIAALGIKLNLYLKDVEEGEGINKQLPDWLWVQCDQCSKWRRLPKGTDKNSLPNLWYCHLNPYNSHNRCKTAEEPDHEDIGKAKGKVLNKEGTVSQATPEEIMTLPRSIHLIPTHTAARNILNKRPENVDMPEEIMTLPRSIHLIPTQTATRNILNKRQEKMSAPNVVAASSSLPDVSTPNTVGER